MDNVFFTVNSFCGFDPLKEVWLGDTYPSDFYHDLPANLRTTWEKITDMTKEDLDVFQKTLESMGIVVRRPKFSSNREDYVNDKGLLVKPPITPRDTNFAFGNEFYHLRMDDYRRDPWQFEIDRMQDHGVQVHFGPRHTDLSCLAPPSVVRVGRDIYVDMTSHAHVWNIISPTFVQWARDYRVHVCDTGGHSDAVFCPVRDGILLTTHWLTDYDKTFPGWQVWHLPKETVAHNRNSSWWIPDEKITGDQTFAQHIQDRALDWIGNYAETQFSINLLVIDRHTVIAVNENKSMRKFLASKGIDVVVCDFRTKSFWDGGAHCLTVDINREGMKRDLFPQRADSNYLDWL